MAGLDPAIHVFEAPTTPRKSFCALRALKIDPQITQIYADRCGAVRSICGHLVIYG
jgi:hypothetical protein